MHQKMPTNSFSYTLTPFSDFTSLLLQLTWTFLKVGAAIGTRPNDRLRLAALVDAGVFF